MPPGPSAPGDGPGAEAAASGVDDGDVRCKLLRGDGSEWTVTGLSLAREGLHVDAYRYVRDGRTPAETRRELLDDVLLRPDDRVWCVNRRGAVLWTLSSPGADDVLPDTGEREHG